MHAPASTQSLYPAPAWTPLIGREQEIALLSTLLQRELPRVITLTGPRGSGKTQLSLHLAAQVDFPDGVVFAMLPPLNSPTMVLSTIGHALGLPEQPPDQLLEAIIERLRQRRLLLVFDTGAQTISRPQIIAELLEQLPQLKLLVCSLQPLGLPDEYEFRLAALSAPDDAAQLPLEQLATYPAIQLFMERAQAAAPGFQLSREHSAAMVEVCSYLEGLPLAIEIVAAHVALMPLDVLWQSLQPFLAFQSPGSRDRATRQQTLQATLDWAWSLLDPAAQSSLAALSMFAGGCTLAAAQAVVPQPAAAVAAHMEQLLKRHLIWQHPAGSDAADVRYAMLEAVRAYASDQRTHSHALHARVSRRYCDWCLQLVETAAPELTGAHPQVWIERLSSEYGNVRSAIQISLLSSDPSYALRFCAALWRFWLMRGYIGEGRWWMELALKPAAAADDALRAAVLNGMGTLLSVQGAYDQARATFRSALDIQRQLGDQRGIGYLLNNLGLVASEQSDRAAASARFEESLAIWRELSDTKQLAITLSNLGALENEQGHYQRAQAVLEESLTYWRELENPWGIAMALANLGEALYHVGQLASAITLLEEGQDLCQRIGDQRLSSAIDLSLAYIRLSQGQLDAARSLLSACLSCRFELDDKRGVLQALEAVSMWALTLEQPAMAAQLLQITEHWRGLIGTPRTPAEQLRLVHSAASLTAELGSAAAQPIAQLNIHSPLKQIVNQVLLDLRGLDS